MPDIVFLHPERVHFLWAAVAFSALLTWLELRGRNALNRFMSAVMQLRLAERASTSRRVVRLLLILAMFVFGILALMRPQTQTATSSVASSRLSADIMIVLDVSKSMLAEDAAPNRLARAKAEISELLDKLTGHRIGLVAFAGRSAVLSPLTPDYGFFKMTLKTAGPDSVSRGGTRIGAALKKALMAFRGQEGAKMILLITDGEDHDSFPLEAAKEARAQGVSVVAIGFGDEKGSEIIITDPQTGAKSALLDKSGQVVRSRLDGALLRKIALETQGAYIPAGVAALDLESIVTDHVKPMVRASAPGVVRVVPTEHYPWFILFSALTCFCAVVVGASAGTRRRTL